MAHQTLPEIDLPDRMIEVCPGQWMDALSILTISDRGRIGITGDYYTFTDMLPIDDLRKQINEIKRAYSRVGVFQ